MKQCGLIICYSAENVLYRGKSEGGCQRAIAMLQVTGCGSLTKEGHCQEKKGAIPSCMEEQQTTLLMDKM